MPPRTAPGTGRCCPTRAATSPERRDSQACVHPRRRRRAAVGSGPSVWSPEGSARRCASAQPPPPTGRPWRRAEPRRPPARHPREQAVSRWRQGTDCARQRAPALPGPTARGGRRRRCLPMCSSGCAPPPRPRPPGIGGRLVPSRGAAACPPGPPWCARACVRRRGARRRTPLRDARRPPRRPTPPAAIVSRRAPGHEMGRLPDVAGHAGQCRDQCLGAWLLVGGERTAEGPFEQRAAGRRGEPTQEDDTLVEPARSVARGKKGAAGQMVAQRLEIVPIQP